MRQALSISLPTDAVRFIQTQVKQRDFSSVSEYIRHLLNLDQELISEDEVLRLHRSALLAHKSGKTKVLKSLADLM